jgi:hypothetical protein
MLAWRFDESADGFFALDIETARVSLCLRGRAAGFIHQVAYLLLMKLPLLEPSTVSQ